MSELNPKPEREESRSTREQRAAFNLGLLSAEEVKRLNVALYLEANLGEERDGRFNLVILLKAAIQNTAQTDPERAREIVASLSAETSQQHNVEMAIDCAPSLASYDYPFARDTIINLLPHDVYQASVSAHAAMMRTLPPEHANDFDTRFDQANGF
ncbi:hypothetical protein [Streptomyces sp. NPDC048663]|uniref:hypothetical protein n=1 Tax=Streptomyces sp. NPDC048663 TaxID=3155638 RepID=UPI00344375A5